ncbi:Protein TRIGALACTOSYLDIACYLGLYCEROL 4 chloroplastic [Melia azedarach]|uniref:Protein TRIGALACTOSYLDIACYLGLYCEROL 4 chloroplastic n=1 Tax=Melia azedarach TaxID=155640 RepID=A0ACC1YVX8_MELAZ|nr:Protein TRIGALACTOSYLDIACYLGLYCEROL 4 chloroplastic [Melia azedarach]
MPNLRTAMDSAFWDQPLSSPLTLDGSANSVPGDPFPLDAARASRVLRIQQLSLLGLGVPFGIIPSYSPPSQKDLGSFCLQSLLFKPSTSNWWLGLIGQLRPKKLISDIKREFSSSSGLELSVIRDAAKHIVDKSHYAIGLCSQLSLGPSSSLLWSTERHGDKKRIRNKLMFYHKLPDHDITVDAAWPQLFLDHKGQYWDVPESISLNILSLVSDSGLRYRFGIQKNSSHPESVNAENGETPAALMPGLCAKAAFSYERSKDIWRRTVTTNDLLVKTDKGQFMRPAYDVHLAEPHISISAIIGGTCEAWFGSKEANASQDGHVSTTTKKRSPLSVDLFGSICSTLQHGKFRKPYGDLTRLDARLDISSFSCLAQRAMNTFSSNSVSNADNSLSSPRLNLIFQQQVLGPVVFGIDSKFLFDSSLGKHESSMEDVIYSLSYCLRLLHMGKVVAWYSPKRKEGMVEFRLFEF